MSKLFLKHPTFTQTQDIKQICKPLNKLGISYFGHGRIENNKFSALTNNPKFLEHYLKHNYYNVDIHTCKSQLGQYIVWDAIECTGTSNKLNIEAEQFGVQHTFTIVEKDQTGINYYHFSNDSNDYSINQIYLTNLDLLQLFISKFNNHVSQSKQLKQAYDLTFSIDENAEGYILETACQEKIENINRTDFIKSITQNRHLSSFHSVILHKDTHKPVLLAPQQIKCLKLLALGKSTKQIADEMQLAYRTVCHYLERVRRLLGCRSSKELIAYYYPQIKILNNKG